MKFLRKTKDFKVLLESLIYREGRTNVNRQIKQLLITEQKNFCAYTEKYISELDSSEVEHFNSSLKYSEDYYNYYAVIRRANQYKKDNEYLEASFYKTLFFQNPEVFNNRVRYLKDGVYEEVIEADSEAKELIAFLGFNHPNLYEQRKRHIKRLKRNFDNAGYTNEKCMQYFRDHKEDLNFVTAIEVELDLDLSEFYV